MEFIINPIDFSQNVLDWRCEVFDCSAFGSCNKLDCVKFEIITQEEQK